MTGRLTRDDFLKKSHHQRTLLHWGPIIAITIISTITYATTVCILQWWPPNTIGGMMNLAVFLNWVFLTLYNFFSSVSFGPGAVPFGWQPKKKTDCEFLQYCNFCEGYKAPRSHHCRKCGRCVMKMDHHCPWINNCIGHRNHAFFTYFLFFAPCGCLHALFTIIPTLYHVINRTLYPQHHYLAYGGGPIVSIGFYSFLICMFSVGLAIGVVIAVGGLCYIQVRTILRNETGIENWIKEKAEYREREEDEDDEDFVYPYDLGRWNNWKMVFGKPDKALDGIWWPVIEGCNQYTLTIEQLKQKREKKDRSILYNVDEYYSGAFCPVTKGVRVVCCVPFSDEMRIPLAPDDKVLVSRWKKHWLYGDKLDKDFKIPKGQKRMRGWFPRRCVHHGYASEDEDDNKPCEEGNKKEN